MKMNNIVTEIQSKNVVQKSKFISFVFFCNNLSHQNKILKKIKNNHPSASHICFASTYENEFFLNDDGEPSGTAGAKILAALKEKKLVNVLCVVVRYFGGEKLGTSKLGKTYKDCARSCLENNIKSVEKRILYSGECSYNTFDSIQKFFQKEKIHPEETIFKKQVQFKVFLTQTEKTFLDKFLDLKNEQLSKFS